MRTRSVAIVILAVVGLAISQPGHTDPAELCDFQEVVIFATNSVQLARDSDTTGNVVANGASPGPVLDEGAELAVDRMAKVTGDLSADSINLDMASMIDGDLAYNDLTDDGAVLGGSQTTPLGLPVFGTLPAFQEADVIGAVDDVFVPAGDTVTLGADVPRVTKYGDILIDKGGKLVFSGGGTFDVRSIGPASTVGGPCPPPCRSIVFNAPTDLRVEGRFDSERNSFVGPEAGAGLSAADIVVYVGGTNGAGGGLFELPHAAQVGRGSTVEANLWAANGRLVLGQDTTATGAFLARDVDVRRGTRVSLASAFVNQPPVANPAGGETAGDVPITITLEGSDPEGGDLTFSIVPGTGPVNGMLGPIDPIEPDPIPILDRNGDPTGEFLQPPITQATVEYDPDGADDLTDAFEFQVTDVCGATATAVVSINPDDPDTVPCPVVPVSAGAIEADVEIGGTVGIELDGDGPACGENLVYRILDLPVLGTLTDVNGNAVTVDSPLPTNLVVYAAAGTSGSDSFIYEVDGGPDGRASAQVTVNLGPRYELAPDSEVSTPLNQPVLVTLIGNPGGAGTSLPTAPSPAPAQSIAEPRPIRARTFGVDRGGAVAAGNGVLSAAERQRAVELAAALTAPRGARSLQGPPRAVTAVGVDQGWVQFGWCDVATSPNCDQLIDLVNESPAIQGPFTFDADGPVCLSVVDTLAKGDHFRVEDNGQTIGFTSSVDQNPAGTTGSPDVAFNDATYSSGSFGLGAGSHSVQVTTIPPDSFAFGTAAYIRVDSGSCLPDLTVTSFEAPDVATLDEAIGDRIAATVTNTGNVPIPAGTAAAIGFYTSSDPEITTADRLLEGGREALSQQAPNGLTIGESVVIDLFDGANVASDFPDTNPPLGNVFIGVLVDEFNAVDELDETDNDASRPIEILPARAGLVWEIRGLPAQGSLIDPGTGQAVFVGQTFNLQPTLLYRPATGISGTFQVEYQVTERSVFDIGLVDITVALLDQCAFNGRPADCAPDSGSTLTDGTSAADEADAAALVYDPLVGPRLTVEIVGPGAVSTSPKRWLGGRQVGIQCTSDHGACRLKYAYGTDIKLMARPLGNARFAGWAGDCWGDEPITGLTIGRESACTAIFEEVDE